MANFFLDNPDILWHFEHIDFAPIVRLVENDFQEVDEYGPEDVADAIDNYRRALEVVGQISADFIAPRAEQIDRLGHTLVDGRVIYSQPLRECLEVLGKADLMGFTLPRRFGGLQFPTLVYTIAIEIVSRADASLMNIFGLQGIAETINAFASEEIKEEYLPRFAAGQITGAMVLTEPDAGSDLQRVKCRAWQDQTGQWRISGVKRFITNGCGDVLLVLARSEPEREGGLGLSLFLCERGPGVYVRRLEDKLGIHGSPTCELRFDEAPAKLIGERQRGLVTYVMALMNGARVGIAAQSLGIAQAALNEARKFAHVRRQFGRPIEQIPPVADMLASSALKLAAARSITYEAARWMDIDNGLARKVQTGHFLPGEDPKSIRAQQRSAKRLSAFLTPLAKYYASEMAIEVTYQAMQVLGGSGYMRDYPLERYYRDARITTIYEGTTQLQIVAAVLAVTSGLAEKRFAELADQPLHGEADQLAGKLLTPRKRLREAVDFAKKVGSDYLDLVARDLVDIAGDIYIGYLLCLQADLDDARLPLARRFIAHALPRIEMKVSRVLSGEDSTLKEFEAIAGPLPEE